MDKNVPFTGSTHNKPGLGHAKARISSQSPTSIEEAQVLEPFPTSSLRYILEGTGLEVEHPDLKLVSLWEANTASGSLTGCATVLVSYALPFLSKVVSQ